MPKFFTVFSFELRNLLKSKAFLISSLITCLVILLANLIPSFMSLGQRTKDSQIVKIAILDRTGIIEQADFQENQNFQIRWIKAGDFEEEKEAVKEAQITALVEVKEFSQYKWYTDRERISTINIKAKILGQVHQSIRKKILEEKGISPSLAQKLSSNFQEESIELAVSANKSQASTHGYTYLISFLIYIMVISYGNLTASAVASEKSSRTMELLITSTKPKHLIHGKVIATSLAGILQLICFSLVFYLSKYLTSFIGENSSESISFLKSMTNIPSHVLVLASYIFLVSYLSFAYIYAALGSLVNSVEEVNQVTAIPTMLFVAVFISSILASFNPDAKIYLFLSFVPLFSPQVFLVRQAMLDLALWEILLAGLIQIATLYLVVKLSISIYEHGVLRYGKLTKIKELISEWKRGKKHGS